MATLSGKSTENIEKIQRDAVKWIYWLNVIPSLGFRTDKYDIQLLRKVEAGEYKVSLTDYIRCPHDYNTRGKRCSIPCDLVSIISDTG